MRMHLTPSAVRRKRRDGWYPSTMAAKKARKRAYIPPTSEVVNRRERTETTRPHRASANARPQRGPRAPHAYPVPSWRRTLKRLPVYFALIFFMQYYLLGREGKIDGNDRILAALGFAGLITVCFAPFMHMMDRFAYNRHLKRSGNGATGS